MPSCIRVEPIGESASLITLDRPTKRNALSIALRDEVSDALEQFASDGSVKSVVIRGAGDFFSAGFDLKEFAAASADPALHEKLWASSDRFHHGLLRFPLPLVAAVNGPALAGGFDLALCCDLRIATTSARFGHPEFTFADVVYSPAHELLGGALARELCLTGRELDAHEALARGLVSELVDMQELDAAIARMTQRIARAPREALIHSKQKAVERARIPADRPTLEL